MKKIIVLLLTIFMLLNLVACRENSSDEKPIIPPAQEELEENDKIEDTEDTDTSQDESTDVNSDYDTYRKIHKYELYVNYKNDRLEERGASSYLFYGRGEDIVIFIFGEQLFETSTEIFEFYNDGGIPRKAIGRADASFTPSVEYIVNVTDSKNTTVNEYDCYNFKGNVTDGDGRICFTYGYTFQVGDVSCMLVGFVFTAEQTDEQIQSIIEEVDTMMQTVRTEE